MKFQGTQNFIEILVTSQKLLVCVCFENENWMTLSIKRLSFIFIRRDGRSNKVLSSNVRLFPLIVFMLYCYCIWNVCLDIELKLSTIFYFHIESNNNMKNNNSLYSRKVFRKYFLAVSFHYISLYLCLLLYSPRHVKHVYHFPWTWMSRNTIFIKNKILFKFNVIVIFFICRFIVDSKRRRTTSNAR